MAIPASMICNCLRCGHRWVRSIEGQPKRCPKCKSPYWATKRGKLPMGRPPKKHATKRKAGG